MKIALLCLLLTVSLLSAENLLTNPGFEDGNTNWDYLNIDTTVAHTGNISAKAVGDNSFQHIIQVVEDIQPGETFNFSGWMKTNLSVDSALIQVRWYNEQNSRIAISGTGELSGTSDWTLFSNEITAPEGTASAHIWLILRTTSSGTAWYDDISFSRVDNSPLVTGNLPADLAEFKANFMPPSWDLSQINRFIWISPTGSGDKSGSSRENADTFGSWNSSQIQSGTAYLFVEGMYDQQGLISLTEYRGTDESPIILVSIDGIGEAVITSSVTASRTTLNGYKCANLGIIGFDIIGTGSLLGGDDSPYKFGGQLYDYNDDDQRSYNLAIIGCTARGTGTDMFKFYDSLNVYLVGCTASGTARQELFDNVSVGIWGENGRNVFAYNNFTGDPGYSAITAKYGSHGCYIMNNHFDLDGYGLTGIILGGAGTIVSYLPDFPNPAFSTAFDPWGHNNSRISYNEFGSSNGGCILYKGCFNCEISYNNLDRNNGRPEIKTANAQGGDLWLDGIDAGNYLLDRYPDFFTSGQMYVVDENGTEKVYLQPYGNLTMYNKIASATENDIDGYTPETDAIIAGNSSSVGFNYSTGATAISSLIEALITEIATLSSN